MSLHMSTQFRFQGWRINGISLYLNKFIKKIKGSSKLTTNIGSEYGKEFGGEGGGGDGGGGIIEGNSLNGRNINTELPYSPSHFTLIPDLFTTTNNRIAKLLPG